MANLMDKCAYEIEINTRLAVLKENFNSNENMSFKNAFFQYRINDVEYF